MDKTNEEIRAEILVKEEMKKRHGQVWNQEEFNREFEAIQVIPEVVIVRRKSDGVSGACFKMNGPTLYYDFLEEKQ